MMLQHLYQGLNTSNNVKWIQWVEWKQFFFCGDFLLFCQKCFVKRIFSCEFPGWKKNKNHPKRKIKYCQKSSQLPTIWKGASDFFYFHILNITKIWLNILVNYPHLSNITKLKKKKHWGERGDQLFNGHLENLPKSHPQFSPQCYPGTPKSKGKIGNILPL
jgi:hypothetical protein